MSSLVLKKRISDYVAGGVVSLSMYIGSKLGLFDALISIATKETPASSEELAAKTDLRERFIFWFF